ncbi:MAG: hypothetical protein QM605_13220 [Sphingobium sp.]
MTEVQRIIEEIMSDAGGAPALASSTLLIQAIGAEAYAVAQTEQADAFFRASGKRFAGAVDLKGVSDLSVFEARINGLWERIGWGQAHLEMTEDAVLIRHIGLPPAFHGERDEKGKRAVPLLLAGAYDAFFEALGSGPALHSRVMSWSSDMLELRHGL